MATVPRAPGLHLLLCLARALLAHGACATEAGCARPQRAGDEPVSLLQTRSEATLRAALRRLGAEAVSPNHTSCTPQCKWQCKTKKCDEVCAPVCDAPKCQTRCTSFDTKACHMECTTPHCAVLCPKRGCPTQNCPACTTKCGEPVCKMACNADPQPCYSVCEQPKCKWQCRAPEHCPEPECEMMCETPKNCMGNTYKKLPPLKKGEIEVKSFTPPASLLGASSGKPPSPPPADVALVSDAVDSGTKAAPPPPADARLLRNTEYMNVSYSFVQDGNSGKRETAHAWLPRMPTSEHADAAVLTSEQIDAKLADLLAPL